VLALARAGGYARAASRYRLPRASAFCDPRHSIPVAGLANVETRVMDASQLDLPSDSFDAAGDVIT
jgi:hypothetical protein